MKSIPVPDPETRKKIMFYDTPARQAQLKIKCRTDGLKQSEFFRLVVEGYLSDDPHIVKYLHVCKEKYNIQGKFLCKKNIEKFDNDKVNPYTNIKYAMSSEPSNMSKQ